MDRLLKRQSTIYKRRYWMFVDYSDYKDAISHTNTFEKGIESLEQNQIFKPQYLLNTML